MEKLMLLKEDYQFQLVNGIIEFLREINNSGIGYTSVCIRRTALNIKVKLPGFPDISENPLIRRFIKVFFNNKPSKPRYTYIWGKIKYCNT